MKGGTTQINQAQRRNNVLQHRQLLDTATQKAVHLLRDI